VVRDGKATLLGAVPSPRHKATAEQDAWHVPGVFAVSNELIVQG
jgi:osmotically-inducible protein OsmY